MQAILGGTIQVPTLTGDVVVKVCTTFFKHIFCIISDTEDWYGVFDYIFVLSREGSSWNPAKSEGRAEEKR